MPEKPRRSMSRAMSNVCRRRPGTATWLMAGRGSRMRYSLVIVLTEEVHVSEAEVGETFSKENLKPYRTSCTLGAARAAATARDEKSLAIKIPRTDAVLAISSPI